MGTTCEHREKGLSNAEWLTAEVLGETQTLVDISSTRGVIYAAVREADGTTWGLVVLTSWSRDYYNFCHKEVSEDMGPNETQCPTRILDVLTPTDSEYASNWRTRCRDYAATKAARPKVTSGDVVRFAEPIKFGNGETLDTFTFEKRSDFRAIGTFGRYRITKWRDRSYEVLVDA